MSVISLPLGRQTVYLNYDNHRTEEYNKIASFEVVHNFLIMRQDDGDVIGVSLTGVVDFISAEDA